MINYILGVAVCVISAVELVWLAATPVTSHDTPLEELLALASDRD